MKRAIVGYGKDEEGDWFAILDCAHLQHVRHRPPFTNRPWVTSKRGRDGKLGELLNCVLCDRFEMPDGLTMYRRTVDFARDSIPQALLSAHRTQTGVWARIVVEQGRLRYHVDEAHVHQDIEPGIAGVIVPELSHRLETLGDVRFHLAFYKRVDPLAP